MKTSQKLILGCAFLIIAILYWVLTPLGVWLIVDDSDAVEKFAQGHRLIAVFAGGMWVLDGIGFRYILIAILAITFWRIVRNPPSKIS